MSTTRPVMAGAPFDERDSDDHRQIPVEEPLDDRDEDDPRFEVDPEFSSVDFDFSSGDPAQDEASEPTATFDYQ